MFMQKINNIFFNAVILAIAAFMSAACMLEKEGPSPEQQNVMIELSVSAGDLTRSTPAPSETKIEMLRVYAFYGSRLAGTTLRSHTALNDPFYMDLELPASGTHDVDFYLIANESEMADENVSMVLSGDMSRMELESIRYNGLMTKNVLPMYCKQTESINVDNVLSTSNTEPGHEGHFVLTQKVSFDMSRSLAKLSIYAAANDGASSDPQILSARILAKGTRLHSYLFPQTEAVLNEVLSRANDRILLSSPKTVVAKIAKGSPDILDPANYDLIMTNEYLPEVTYGSTSWNMSSGNDRETVLHIEYNLGAGKELRNAYVYLPPVIRNTHIKVCILINAEGQIVINYTVADWIDNDMVDYSFDYPTHSYIRDFIPTTSEQMYMKPSSPAQMSETIPFKGYFQMTNPLTDSWTPTLLGLNASECTIRVFEEPSNTEIPFSTWPIESSDNWYRIEVMPKTGYMSLGEEVKLAVSYRATGFDVIDYLLINGVDMEYFWPYTGSETQDANYIIITMVN